jgi:hypothetical protein
MTTAIRKTFAPVLAALALLVGNSAAQEAPPGEAAPDAGHVLIQLATLMSDNPLGISIEPVDPALASHLSAEGALLVTAVKSDPPISLQPLDVIVRMMCADNPHHDLASPMTADDLNRALSELAGQQVTFEIIRAAQPMTVEAQVPQPSTLEVATVLTTLGTNLAHQCPAMNQVQCASCHGATGQFGFHWVGAQPDAATTEPPRYRIGLSLAVADDVLQSHLGIDDDAGLVVTEVIDEMPAAQAGIQVHDVLVELDGHRLIGEDAVGTLLQEIKDRSVTLRFYRGGQEISVEITATLETAEAQGLWLVQPAITDSGMIHWRLAIADEANRTEMGWLLLADEQKADAATQIAQLKAQLDAMRASIEALEITLAESQSAQTPSSPEGGEGDK